MKEAYAGRAEESKVLCVCVGGIRLRQGDTGWWWMDGGSDDDDGGGGGRGAEIYCWEEEGCSLGQTELGELGRGWTGSKAEEVFGRIWWQWRVMEFHCDGMALILRITCVNDGRG